MLSVMAVKGKTALKTQFAINEACIIIIAWITQASNNFLKNFQSEMVCYTNMLFFLQVQLLTRDTSDSPSQILKIVVFNVPCFRN